MSTLIVPICGLSSRYPNLPPKWTLDHPDGKNMLHHAVQGLGIEPIYDKIYVVILERHKGYKTLDIPHERIILKEQTSSQPETVLKAILEANITGEIGIKDCDNSFCIDSLYDNTVVYCRLTKEIANPNNKSYIETSDDNRSIVNIVEKRVVSDKFCCGLYNFESAEQFKEYYYKLENQKQAYISDIIFKMLLDGIRFKPLEAQSYQDWGTLSDWNNYINKKSCVGQ